jgi:hypothetical protein
MGHLQFSVTSHLPLLFLRPGCIRGTIPSRIKPLADSVELCNAVRQFYSVGADYESAAFLADGLGIFRKGPCYQFPRRGVGCSAAYVAETLLAIRRWWTEPQGMHFVRNTALTSDSIQAIVPHEPYPIRDLALARRPCRARSLPGRQN